MKKSRLWVGFVALFLMFITAGCSNQASEKSSADYNTLMNQGKEYVDDHSYSKAEDKFEQAHQIKATKESKAYADQADKMDDAYDSIHDYKFKTALNTLNKVKEKNNGYSVMTTQAKSLYNTIDEVDNNIKNEINPLYKQAKAAYQNKNYSDAENLCTQILDLPYLDGQYAKYYKQIKNNVKNLLNDAKDAAGDSKSSNSKSSNKDTDTNNSGNENETDTNSGSQSSDSTNSSVANSSSSSNSNSSNSSTTSSQSNSSSASNSSNNMTVGGQAVTARVVAQVREKLSSIGVNTSSWSDQDVANFMNSAAQNGHTTIDSYTQSDVNNFTK